MKGYFINEGGGRPVESFYCGMAPFFCPDIMAKALKVIEPMVEKIPLVKQLSCAVYVLKIKGKK